MNKIDVKLGGNSWQARLRDEADQSVFNEIFKLGEYRSADEAIKNAKDAIVDVGAHAGFFSMYCRALNKKVKIFAVEPESKNLKSLKQHLEENKISGVKIIPGALAKESGERELFLSNDSHNHFVAPRSYEMAVDNSPRLGGAGPQARGGLADDSTATEMSNPPLPRPSGELRPTITVNALSFADFCKQNKIKKISLLKIDIEGEEYELFEGMSENDFAVVKFVILEYHNGSKYKYIVNKLRANGFGVQVFPSHFDKTMGFIWANNKRLKN